MSSQATRYVRYLLSPSSNTRAHTQTNTAKKAAFDRAVSSGMYGFAYIAKKEGIMLQDYSKDAHPRFGTLRRLPADMRPFMPQPMEGVNHLPAYFR